MVKDRMVGTSVTLPTSMLNWLEELADAKGVSVSELIRGFIRDVMDADQA